MCRPQAPDHRDWIIGYASLNPKAGGWSGACPHGSQLFDRIRTYQRDLKAEIVLEALNFVLNNDEDEYNQFLSYMLSMIYHSTIVEFSIENRPIILIF